MKSAITSHLPSARWMMTDCSFLLSSNPFMNNVGCNELDNARHNRSGKSRVTQRLPTLLTAFPMSSELSQFQSSLPSPAYLPAFATVPPIIGLAFVPRYFVRGSIWLHSPFPDARGMLLPLARSGTVPTGATPTFLAKTRYEGDGRRTPRTQGRSNPRSTRRELVARDIVPLQRYYYPLRG